MCFQILVLVHWYNRLWTSDCKLCTHRKDKFQWLKIHSILYSETAVQMRGIMSRSHLIHFDQRFRTEDMEGCILKQLPVEGLWIFQVVNICRQADLIG